MSTPGPASGSASAGNNTPATQKKNGDAHSKRKVGDFIFNKYNCFVRVEKG